MEPPPPPHDHHTPVIQQSVDNNGNNKKSHHNNDDETEAIDAALALLGQAAHHLSIVAEHCLRPTSDHASDLVAAALVDHSRSLANLDALASPDKPLASIYVPWMVLAESGAGRNPLAATRGQLEHLATRNQLVMGKVGAAGALRDAVWTELTRAFPDEMARVDAAMQTIEQQSPLAPPPPPSAESN